MSSSNVTVVPLIATRHKTPDRVSPAVRPHPHPPVFETDVTVASPIQLALTIDAPESGLALSNRSSETVEAQELYRSMRRIEA
jgi:hypothetical protein